MIKILTFTLIKYLLENWVKNTKVPPPESQILTLWAH